MLRLSIQQICDLFIYLFFFFLLVFPAGVPFLSYDVLVLLIDLHKQLLFAAGVDPALSWSTFTFMGWLHISWKRVIHDNVNLAELTKALLNCVDERLWPQVEVGASSNRA